MMVTASIPSNDMRSPTKTTTHSLLLIVAYRMVKEINELKSQCPNIIILILDHHKCPAELPKANAIVNPQLADESHPARHLCSAALIDYIFRTTPIHDINPDLYIDLTAIGLVADVMPLTKLNRWYVKRPEELKQIKNCNFRALH